MYSKLSKEILLNHGSVKKNCFLDLLNKSPDPGKENGPPEVKKSNYYDLDHFLKCLTSSTDFSLLSMNIQGLKQKFKELEVWIDKIQCDDLNLSCLLLQETHLDKDICEVLTLPGYINISRSPSVSKFGGLAMFLKDGIPFKELSFEFNHELWEAQFIEIDFKEKNYYCAYIQKMHKL